MNSQNTKLIMVRHGESEANRQGIFAGHTDIDLVDNGIKQAELTAKYIAANYKVDKIYSSDLLRAYRTAECISKETGIEIIKESKLREIFAGEWEGKEISKLIDLFPDDFSVWNNDIGKTICTGGESVEELGKRIVTALTQIAEENIGKTVVIATHATPVRVTEALLRAGSLGCMRDIPFVSNASVTELVYSDGSFAFTKIGYDAHLSNLKTNSLA